MDVVRELSLIRDQLKIQAGALLDKEERLREREDAITEKERLAEEILNRLDHQETALKNRESLLLEVEESIAVCCTAIEECVQKEIQQGVESSKLHIKKENVRLKEGLKSVCSMNEKLKAQLKEKEIESDRIKKQLSVVQARMACLKLDRQKLLKNPEPAPSKTTQPTQSNQSVEVKSPDEKIPKIDKEIQIHWEQLVCNLVQWISVALVALESSEDISTLSDMLCTSTFSLFGWILPVLSFSHHLVCLRFICRTLCHATPEAKASVTASLRRIGEICCSPLTSTKSLEKLKPCFCGSSDILTRVLSCLVVLQSIRQVDVLHLVLQSCKRDLVHTKVQLEFIALGGIDVLLPYVRSLSKYKVVLGAALDIFLVIGSDYGLKHFITKDWFNAVSDLLQSRNFLTTSHLEKLSILLQRLSTQRESRAFFNKFELVSLLQSSSGRELTPFVQLNISSILTNLD